MKNKLDSTELFLLHNTFAIFVFLDAFGNDQHKEVIHLDLSLQTRVVGNELPRIKILHNKME